MDEKEFFYKIDGYSPSKTGFGVQFGFSTSLDIELAKKAYQTRIKEEVHDNIQKMAKLIIIDSGLAGQDETIRKPYSFIRGEDNHLTNLLHFCTVPGNSCDLGLDINGISELKKESDLKTFISYDPHNIDSINQAYALLSIWIYWAERAHTILS